MASIQDDTAPGATGILVDDDAHGRDNHRFVVDAPLMRQAPTEDLAALAHAMAPDPSVFDDHERAYWTAVISTNQVDHYFTRMAPTTLQNFADAAARGIPFQDHHQRDGVSRMIGRSIQGRYIDAGGDGVARVEATFFAVRGSDAVTDTFLTKMRAGIARDVSVGFFGGVHRCSICGRDMWRDLECVHFPGQTYPVEVTTGTGAARKEMRLCLADVEDASLSEVSTVFRGATPNAVITKVYREIDAGRVAPDTIRALEETYHVRITPRPVGTLSPERAPASVVPDIPVPRAAAAAVVERQTAPEDSAMGHDPEAERGQSSLSAAEDMTTRITTILTRAGAPVGASPEWLADRIAELAPLAEDGRAFRASLIADALTDGVRAFGNAFDRTDSEALLTSLPIARIMQFRTAWRAIGDAALPGGRVSSDTAALAVPSTERASTRPAIPDEAFRTR